MKKIPEFDGSYPIAVTLEELATLLGCGKASAREIAELANARMPCGRRVFFHIEKIRNYINSCPQEIKD